MTRVVAHLKYYRSSPRKVRLLSDVIKGKKAREAVVSLNGTVKRSAPAVLKLLKSAMANAKHNFKIDAPENLVVSSFTVNEGPVLKRQMPKARGSANLIRKRMSHVTLVLSDDKEKKHKKA